MQFNRDDIVLILLTLLVVIVVGYSLYRTYGQATTVEKLLMVRRLVNLAQEVFTEPMDRKGCPADEGSYQGQRIVIL